MNRASRYRTDRRIHSRRIASARQNSDCFYLICHLYSYLPASLPVYEIQT